MNLEKVKLDDLKDGDQIAVHGDVADISPWLRLVTVNSNGKYLHHGIYSNEEKCVYDVHGATKDDAKPRKCDLMEFLGGRTELYRVVYQENACLPVEETLEMAEEAVNGADRWPRYHLIKNNCESFATLLKTGRATSEQALASLMEAKVIKEDFAKLGKYLGIS